MKKCFWFAMMIFCAITLACSDPSQNDTDAGADAGDTDSYADSETDYFPPDYDWSEGEIISIKNSKHYQWAIKDQVNVIVAFVDGDYKENELYKGIAEQTDYHLPWLWLATVEKEKAPGVFEFAEVESSPTFKFFSYGVEMKDLELTAGANDNDVHLNTSALMKRYEPDILKPATAGELAMMLVDIDNPILVKFGDKFDGPSIHMTQRLKLASIEYGDNLLDAEENFIRDEKLLTIIEVDVNEVPDVQGIYGFYAIPLSIFYNDGVRGPEILLSRPYHQLKKEIESFLDTCN